MSGFASEQTFEMFTFYNLSILFINLLPIWPLDGGTIQQQSKSAETADVCRLRRCAF
jgi:Zn-dependent protease